MIQQPWKRHYCHHCTKNGIISQSRNLRSAECASLTTRILHNSPLQSVTGVWNWVKKNDLGFDKHSEKCTLFDFHQGEKGFWYLNQDSKENSETMSHLKTLTMVTMVTKLVSGDSSFYKLSGKPYLNRFWEWVHGFARRHNVPPPPFGFFSPQRSLVVIELTKQSCPVLLCRWRHRLHRQPTPL